MLNNAGSPEVLLGYTLKVYKAVLTVPLLEQIGVVVLTCPLVLQRYAITSVTNVGRPSSSGSTFLSTRCGTPEPSHCSKCGLGPSYDWDKVHLTLPASAPQV